MKKLFLIIAFSSLLNPLFSTDANGNGEEKPEWVEINGHYILFKKEYKLLLYPVLYDLPESKLYIKNVYSSMVYDQLRLTKKIIIPDPAPAEILYSSQTNEEDPWNTFMKDYVSHPGIFKLLVVPAAAFPASIKFPENIITDPATARLLVPEEVHAVSFITANDKMYSFKIYLIRNGKVFYQTSMESGETDLSKNLFTFAQGISAYLSQSETGTIELSASEPKSSVYINDQFAGYAPVTLPNTLSGVTSITIRKYGYKLWKKLITLNRGEKITLHADLDQLASLSRIFVQSNQENCDVYIGVDYKGQTPVEITDVTPGKHRIRIIKEGYIDYYKTIEVADGENRYDVIAELKKGNSIDYFTPGRPVLLGLPYEKLFKTSGLITLGTGLLGVIFLSEKEKALNTISSYESSDSSTALSDFPLHFDTLRENANTFEALQTGFFITSAAFFISTIYFYIRFINEQDIPVVLNQPSNNIASNRVQVNLNISPDLFHFTFTKGY